jgi:hypothetical protein
MKLVSTAILAAGLVALSACGGGSTAENNAADLNTLDETYNALPDDLGNAADEGLDANAVDLNAVDANAADAAAADADVANTQ